MDHARTHARLETMVNLQEADFDCDEEALAAAVKRRSVFNLIHLETLLKVAFVLLNASEYRKTEFARRRKVSVAGQDVWFVAPDDLVLSKLLWAKDSHSELQLRDVATYLSHWVEQLDLESLYDEVRP